MLWLSGYFDAAGHPDGEHALVIGGYMSSAPAWLRFDKAWIKALKKAGIGDDFHMADFMAGEKKFKAWKGRDEDQERVLLTLARITKKHVRRSFSTTVLLDHWNEVNKVYQLRESHCSPYGIGGFYLMDRSMRWLARRERRFQVRFVFEQGDKDRGDLIWMFDQFAKQDPRNKGFAPIFQPKSLTPLQAADFVLWEQRRLAKDRITSPEAPPPVRKPLLELMKMKRTWGILDEPVLVKFCDDFEIPKRGVSGIRWSPIASVRKARGAGRP